MAREQIALDVAGHEVRLSNPGKVYFPAAGHTKKDLVDYYLAVADTALVHLRERPTVLKRYVGGADREPFFQKRVPDRAPEWLETATVRFPSGREARELTPTDAAHLVWAVNLGVIDFNPWPVRRADLDRPDELRVDLDPTPDATWDDVRQVAMCVKTVLDDHGLVGFPKTSGSRGIHVNARVSMPLTWEQVPAVEPADYTLATVPAILARNGDPHAAIDAHAGSLDQLLDLARRDEDGGLGDAPWPPNFAKQPGEPKRVQPSRARRGSR